MTMDRLTRNWLMLIALILATVALAVSRGLGLVNCDFNSEHGLPALNLIAA